MADAEEGRLNFSRGRLESSGSVASDGTLQVSQARQQRLSMHQFINDAIATAPEPLLAGEPELVPEESKCASSSSAPSASTGEASYRYVFRDMHSDMYDDNSEVDEDHCGNSDDNSLMDDNILRSITPPPIAFKMPKKAKSATAPMARGIASMGSNIKGMLKRGRRSRNSDDSIPSRKNSNGSIKDAIQSTNSISSASGSIHQQEESKKGTVRLYAPLNDASDNNKNYEMRSSLTAISDNKLETKGVGALNDEIDDDDDDDDDEDEDDDDDDDNDEEDDDDEVDGLIVNERRQTSDISAPPEARKKTMKEKLMNASGFLGINSQSIRGGSSFGLRRDASQSQQPQSQEGKTQQRQQQQQPAGQTLGEDEDEDDEDDEDEEDEEDEDAALEEGHSRRDLGATTHSSLPLKSPGSATTKQSPWSLADTEAESRLLRLVGAATLAVILVSFILSPQMASSSAWYVIYAACVAFVWLKAPIAVGWIASQAITRFALFGYPLHLGTLAIVPWIHKGRLSLRISTTDCGFANPPKFPHKWFIYVGRLDFIVSMRIQALPQLVFWRPQAIPLRRVPDFKCVAIVDVPYIDFESVSVNFELCEGRFNINELTKELAEREVISHLMFQHRKTQIYNKVYPWTPSGIWSTIKSKWSGKKNEQSSGSEQSSILRTEPSVLRTEQGSRANALHQRSESANQDAESVSSSGSPLSSTGRARSGLPRGQLGSFRRINLWSPTSTAAPETPVTSTIQGQSTVSPACEECGGASGPSNAEGISQTTHHFRQRSFSSSDAKPLESCTCPTTLNGPSPESLSGASPLKKKTLEGMRRTSTSRIPWLRRTASTAVDTCPQQDDGESYNCPDAIGDLTVVPPPAETTTSSANESTEGIGTTNEAIASTAANSHISSSTESKTLPSSEASNSAAPSPVNRLGLSVNTQMSSRKRRSKEFSKEAAKELAGEFAKSIRPADQSTAADELCFPDLNEARTILRDVLPNKLQVTIIRARNLVPGERSLFASRSTDPKVVIKVREHQAVSSTRYKTTKPLWQEVFEFPVTDPSAVLQISILDEDLAQTDFLGQWVMTLKYLIVDPAYCWHEEQGFQIDREQHSIQGWFPLMSKKWERRGECGEIEMRIAWVHDPLYRNYVPPNRSALNYMDQNSRETNLRLGSKDRVMNMLNHVPVLFNIQRVTVRKISFFLQDLFRGSVGHAERLRRRGKSSDKASKIRIPMLEWNTSFRPRKGEPGITTYQVLYAFFIRGLIPKVFNQKIFGMALTQTASGFAYNFASSAQSFLRGEFDLKGIVHVGRKIGGEFRTYGRQVRKKFQSDQNQDVRVDAEDEEFLYGESRFQGLLEKCSLTGSKNPVDVSLQGRFFKRYLFQLKGQNLYYKRLKHGEARKIPLGSIQLITLDLERRVIFLHRAGKLSVLRVFSCGGGAVATPPRLLKSRASEGLVAEVQSAASVRNSEHEIGSDGGTSTIGSGSSAGTGSVPTDTGRSAATSTSQRLHMLTGQYLKGMKTLKRQPRSSPDADICSETTYENKEEDEENMRQLRAWFEVLRGCGLNSNILTPQLFH